ncbi:MAG: hypothetical protein KC561_17545, partial [Myxococcales bacterium]|nr:hypothetical protein [Myxococcales bacterium]
MSERLTLQKSWPALGLGAGITSALLLAIAEWLGLGSEALHGAKSSLTFVLTCTAVYGFITLPLGLGFGLSIAGMASLLGLPKNWRALERDDEYRSRHETTAAAAILWIILCVGGVAVAGFAAQVSFARNMHNPMFSGAFVALTVAAMGILLGAFSGVGIG